MSAMSEVHQIDELLEKAREDLANAAMRLSDVEAMCREATSGKVLPMNHAARLVGLARAAQYDAESAVEMSKKASKGLLEQLHLAETELRAVAS